MRLVYLYNLGDETKQLLSNGSFILFSLAASLYNSHDEANKQ